MRLPLDPGEIHLWCTFFHEIRDGSLLEAYRRLLTEEERQRCVHLEFEEVQHRFLVTRALVRTVLSRYADVAAADWRFVPNAFGRPEIADEDPQARRIAFNLAHSDELVVLAVAPHQALGVDTETVRDRRALLEIAERFFSREEVAALIALPDDLRAQRFFEYWTLKESYVKARARGLTLPLDRFGFRFPGDDRVELFVEPDHDDRQARWRFWQLSIADAHLVAVCAERIGEERPRLVLTQVVPLVSERGLDGQRLRTSG